MEDIDERLKEASDALRQIASISFDKKQGSDAWRLDWCGKKASETIAILDGRNWRDG